MLTLLLTLKDRYHYTENILTYFNTQKFKYNILISDGSSIENQKKLQNNINKYKFLNITIFNYEPDHSLNDYYNKLKHSSSQITTKYTLLIDNDDYFSEESCTNAINFLEKNPLYVAAGQICHFIKHQNSIYFHNGHNEDNLHDESIHRINNYLNNPLPIWGLLIKTELVKETFSFFVQCNLQYLHLNEFLFNLYIVNKGKIKYIYDSPCTFRRMVSSESSSSTFLNKDLHYNFYYKDFFYKDWKIFTTLIKQICPNIEEKLLEEYWFKGCIRGYNTSKSKILKYKKNHLLLSIYYKIKYRKNWSKLIREFELKNNFF